MRREIDPLFKEVEPRIIETRNEGAKAAMAARALAKKELDNGHKLESMRLRAMTYTIIQAVKTAVESAYKQ